MKVVKFKYYDEFHCIGPECKDCCCQYWHILLSKREYLNYKKMKCSPELRAIMDTAFRRTKNYGSDNAYAEVKLKPDGKCPLWGEDSLCMLQKELGEKTLSFTCRSFPRLEILLDKEVCMQACSVTCYHVVELLMNHPEGLALEECENEKTSEHLNFGYSSGGFQHKDWNDKQIFLAIKNAQIDILQNRNFTISERMLILGFFCQKASEYIKESPEKIPGLAHSLLDNDLCAKIAESLKAPQSDSSAASKTVDIIFKMKRMTKSGSAEHLVNLINQISEGIGLTVVEKDDGTADVFCDKEKYDLNLKTYREIEKERPYIFENVLVNLIFAQGNDRGIWGDYFSLAIFYNVLRVSIASFLKEDWDDSDLAAAITNTAKAVLNSGLSSNGTIADFIAHNSYSLPYVAFLIS